MGSGFRTFASGEVLTSDNVQNYLMDQAVMVFAGTAARGSALPSPETGMTAYSTATGLQVYDGDDWVDVGGAGYGVATGGTAISPDPVIDGVTYRVLQFTSTGTLTNTKAGLFDYMLIAGGGGGLLSGGFGAGGGAGGISTGTVYLDANATITVGGGGSGGTSGPTNGVDSTIEEPNTGDYPLLNVGRGGGAGGVGTSNAGRDGGSGGGGVANNGAGGLSLNRQGRAGGAATTVNTGGGGGGATGVGVAAPTGTGGAGFNVSAFIGGSALTKSVGGSGSPTPAAGGANTGTGGAAAAGGSGIVYIRFKV